MVESHKFQICFDEISKSQQNWLIIKEENTCMTNKFYFYNLAPTTFLFAHPWFWNHMVLWIRIPPYGGESKDITVWVIFCFRYSRNLKCLASPTDNFMVKEKIMDLSSTAAKNRSFLWLFFKIHLHPRTLPTCVDVNLIKMQVVLTWLSRGNLERLRD